MVRPRQFDPADVDEALLDVFWSRGYARTAHPYDFRSAAVDRDLREPPYPGGQFVHSRSPGRSLGRPGRRCDGLKPHAPPGDRGWFRRGRRAIRRATGASH